MVECKSVVSQKMQVGKEFILAMFKNEAFFKTGQFYEMPCLLCCNYKGCGDFVFRKQNAF